MSYHLRLLAEHGFVQEVAERAHGRERWWRPSPGPHWIPRERLSDEGRAEASGLQPPGQAESLGDFERFRAARESLGQWGRGTWTHLRATLRLTLDEARELVAEQQRLIGRYRRAPSDAPPEARTVVVDVLAYPRTPQPSQQRPHPGDRA